MSNLSPKKAGKEDKEMAHEEIDETFQSMLKSLLTVKSTKANTKDFEEGVLNCFDMTSETRTLSKIYIKRLMQLGYSGSIIPQRLFAKAMDKVLAFQAAKDYLFSPSGDSDQSGADLLNKLLWCADFDDSETRLFALQAIEKLTQNTEGIYSYIAKQFLHFVGFFTF